MGMISDWPSMAACQSGDPDALFVQGAEQNVASWRKMFEAAMKEKGADKVLVPTR